MKAPAWNHRKVPRLCRGIESGYLSAQPLVMFGLDASFGARAIKALKPAVTECLYHEILYPDRIQDAMTWRFEAGARLTFHVRVRQTAKVPGPFRRLSPSIALKRNFLAVDLTVSLAWSDKNSSKFSDL